MGGTDRATDKTGVGWVQGTVREAPADEVLTLVERHLGASEAQSFGTRWYAERSTVGLNGSSVQHGHRAGHPGTFVSVTQTDCDVLGTDGVLALLRELADVGFRATRIDTYSDNAASPRPSEVYEAWEGGQKVSRSREVGLSARSGRREEKCSIGSRQSGGYLRIYEDDGHGPGVRWEFEAKGVVAQEVARALLAGVPLGQLHWGLVVGLVDFRDRQAAAHGERAERSGWFARLIEGAEAVRAVVAVKVDHLARRAAWLTRQVLPSLATVWLGYGDAWLNSALAGGMDRMRPRDRAVLAAVLA